ncbi:MAG: Hpt domain-containing protein, partial [Planctomycetes bacterium]|nr:Hpt domain-containing protein [Planctomycetota bacterium]
MTDDADDLQELINDFVTESREHLSTVENDLLLLEQGNATADTVNNVFRCVHSVKGVAGFLGLDTIQSLAHALESTLDLIRKDRLKPNPELIGTLLGAI